ncbi:MAG: glycosyltransferase family 4 protein [Bacteroidota bacterium]
MLYPLITLVLLMGMLAYFKVAIFYRIIDKPNERSSHSVITIRGGGIIYLLAALILLVLYSEFWMPVLGLLIIGAISFADDRLTLSGKIRLLFHLIAVSLLFLSLNIYQLFPWWLAIALYIFVIGIINAYNFMDGINGVTGLYSLVILLGLQYINITTFPFINTDVIWLPILASIVFLFFNFRKRAKCFAGDVGSVTIAFWIIWIMLTLMLKSNNYIYILFLAIYGVDSILTIIHRLLRKENIFEAHRLHFYQILANELKIPHLVVSSLYALLQLGIIILIIESSLSPLIITLIALLPLVLIYIGLKPKLMEIAKIKAITD